MSSFEFPDLLYPEPLHCSDQPHEILLDQWSVTSMDLNVDKSFVMQKIAPTHQTSALRAMAPPFTYSIAREDLKHMNKYTLSTKYRSHSTRLIAQHRHLVYVTRRSQLNIQAIPDSIYDELWSDTVEHLSTTPQRKHVIQLPNSIQLVDCIGSSDDTPSMLTIALSDQKGLLFYNFDPISTVSTLASHIETPDESSIRYLSFNPYVPSNAILIDEHHRAYLLDDTTLTFLHQLPNETDASSTSSPSVFLGWDASPFLYTVTNTQTGSCLLFDLRVRNESFKELFTLGSHHPYLSATELIRGYQASAMNPYQHVFVTDYSLAIIDSRMPNRAAIHSHHELLRTPTCLTQTKWKDQHCIFINDEYNTNVLEYSRDTHRRLTQTSPVWELCPMSNSGVYLTAEKEILLAQSIYFDVPIRDMAIVPDSKAALLFQLNSAGNIHVQLLGEPTDKDEEKTWNPDPDRLLPRPPDCFRRANSYWSSKFLPLFQCPTCSTYNVEPTKFAIVTPFRALTQTSLRDFPTFKNEHQSTEKTIPAELQTCPTCSCLPDLNTDGQLLRAKNWVQDWKSKLDEIQQESIDPTPIVRPTWRQIFDYDELNRANEASTLWSELHRAWWPVESTSNDSTKLVPE